MFKGCLIQSPSLRTIRTYPTSKILTNYTSNKLAGLSFSKISTLSGKFFLVQSLPPLMLSLDRIMLIPPLTTLTRYCSFTCSHQCSWPHPRSPHPILLINRSPCPSSYPQFVWQHSPFPLLFFFRLNFRQWTFVLQGIYVCSTISLVLLTSFYPFIPPPWPSWTLPD